MARYTKAIVAAIINIIALIVVIVMDKSPDDIPVIIQAINGVVTTLGVYQFANKA